ncbi:hypothetical protein, partial [Serratia plymuthica]|uniref:hypothetical protein n=1 Tax=Serratia plymuthica TaxID=82996 RepID=UPI001E617FED
QSILDSACAGPKGEAKGRINPARPAMLFSLRIVSINTQLSTPDKLHLLQSSFFCRNSIH